MLFWFVGHKVTVAMCETDKVAVTRNVGSTKVTSCSIAYPNYRMKTNLLK